MDDEQRTPRAVGQQLFLAEHEAEEHEEAQVFLREQRLVHIMAEEQMTGADWARYFREAFKERRHSATFPGSRPWTEDEERESTAETKILRTKR